jgi:two-component system sensor histidine kinase BarA
MFKGVAISLATKCQLLFGLAVLVIIAGALAVPWQRMEQLAGQQNVKAARMLADVTLRQVHSGLPRGLFDEKNWNIASLPDVADYQAPKIIVLKIPGQAMVENDPISNAALDDFQSRPKEFEVGKLDSSAHLYRYAAAVRADESCIRCHTQWESWVHPHATTAATNTMHLNPTTTTAPATSLPVLNPAPAAPTGLPLDASAETPLVAIIRVDLPWQIDENQLLLNRIVVVVAGMLGGMLAIVVFYLITNRLILQPVRVLRNTAEKVGRGDLNIRSAISTGDEFQQLSETFNNMLATLSASQTQLEATNRSLDTRVGELAQTNVDLYEANRLKSEFLTNVSHELRTPLNAIIGFAELMAENPAVADDPRTARYVENVLTSARQLLELINDLLDLAKIEAGKLILRREAVNVADICDAMVSFMRPLAQKKNLTLTTAVPADLPPLQTDPARLQQVLYNFLSNAIKFTPQEGAVRIAAGKDADERVWISISDTGPGIAPEDQETIFQKFRQIDGSVTRQHSGTGLGLAIARELATLLGASIELTSTVGKGATFTVRIQVQPFAADGPVLGSSRIDPKLR